MHRRRNPPDYTGDRPEPAVSGYVSHTASASVPVPRAAFLAWANGRELGDLVEAGEGMPAVAGTTPLRGNWNPDRDRTGDRRRVEFADGTYLAEEVLTDTPDRFRYMIWGFTGTQRFAVRYAVAEFTYIERARGTDVHWTYSFRPTSPLTRPFVAAFVRRTMTSMMSATLERMRSGAERDLVR
ncbi:polyketide cyclase/dehydrase/lipid transport protein [Pseudonocardia hierapolitana]|uniref:Polyketide cyclase/dehydrase/lipid transport protein n=1 Tax=Pseudonocardia hierapolitana TaxID=1128676 RepID=A0A561SHF8_9PSEU|nr:SRPBCC family protein [Pseudonocardia hierapolitana]TWF74301.1 polyketide cyclase/dehydrase/lipid transport protein [Pseudonocardia hierapolitana]